MKFQEKLQKISKKSDKRIERVGIILGASLLAACFLTYFVVDAFGQQEFQLDCPKGAYHGIDRQGNEACRDIQSNQIVEPESTKIINSDLEETSKSDSWINNPESGESISYEQITQMIIFALIGIAGSVVIISLKKKKLEILQRHGWNSVEKEQVRDRQYGRCNMCFTSTSQWKYDHIDGNKKNNDLNNCQGLCPNCYSVKKERDSQAHLYQ